MKKTQPANGERKGKRMALMHVDFFSRVLGMCMNMDVILPENTQGLIGMGGKAEETFPTLYLLHGMSDDHTIWQRRTNIERYVADKNLAVVMPSTHLAWYTDTTYGLDYLTYISDELPRICRSFFRGMSDKREDTFIAGLSMGGYGAWKAALTHPETFSHAASLSGALDMVGRMAQRKTLGSKASEAYWQGIFGDLDKLENSPHDLYHLAQNCKKAGVMPRLYQCCGTEDALMVLNTGIREKVRALGFDLTYEEGPGDHNWAFWDEYIRNVLDWLPLDKANP